MFHVSNTHSYTKRYSHTNNKINKYKRTKRNNPTLAIPHSLRGISPHNVESLSISRRRAVAKLQNYSRISVTFLFICECADAVGVSHKNKTRASAIKKQIGVESETVETRMWMWMMMEICGVQRAKRGIMGELEVAFGKMCGLGCQNE